MAFEDLQKQSKEQREQALNALAESGTAGVEAYRQAQSRISEYSQEALKNATTSQAGLGQMEGHEIRDLRHLTGEPFSQAGARLGARQADFESDIARQSASLGGYLDKVTGSIPLYQAQLEADLALARASYGGGGGGGGGGGSSSSDGWSSNSESARQGMGYSAADALRDQWTQAAKSRVDEYNALIDEAAWARAAQIAAAAQQAIWKGSAAGAIGGGLTAGRTAPANNGVGEGLGAFFSRQQNLNAKAATRSPNNADFLSRLPQEDKDAIAASQPRHADFLSRLPQEDKDAIAATMPAPGGSASRARPTGGSASRARPVDPTAALGQTYAPGAFAGAQGSNRYTTADYVADQMAEAAALQEQGLPSWLTDDLMRDAYLQLANVSTPQEYAQMAAQGLFDPSTGTGGISDYELARMAVQSQLAPGTSDEYLAYLFNPTTDMEREMEQRAAELALAEQQRQYEFFQQTGFESPQDLVSYQNAQREFAAFELADAATQETGMPVNPDNLLGVASLMGGDLELATNFLVDPYVVQAISLVNDAAITDQESLEGALDLVRWTPELAEPLLASWGAAAFPALRVLVAPAFGGTSAERFVVTPNG